MGTIRDAKYDPKIHRPVSRSSFDHPEGCDILIDDISELIILRIDPSIDCEFISFDKWDEFQRKSILRSARGIQLRRRL